ncbi:MAG TPA: urease accessory protein UreD [Roseomonas sp.]|jgi:urease accessory protein
MPVREAFCAWRGLWQLRPVPPTVVPIPPSHQRAAGQLEIGFGRAGLRHLFQVAPLRALFPTPEPDEAPTIAMVNTAGGLAGGDTARIAVRLEAGARVTCSTPAAEKVYRSLGPDSALRCALAVDAGARLEWIPQETILFDGARFTRRIEVDLGVGASLLAAEAVIFGRPARREAFTHGLYRDAWRIRRDGRLLWADGIALEDPAALRDPFGFGGAEAMATLLLAADDAAALLPALRDAGCPVTLPRPGLLLARWLGGAAAVRGLLGQAICRLRAAALGLPPRLPRLWTT